MAGMEVLGFVDKHVVEHASAVAVLHNISRKYCHGGEGQPVGRRGTLIVEHFHGGPDRFCARHASWVPRPVRRTRR